MELTLTNTFIDPVQEAADITIRVGRLVDSGLIGKVVCTHRYLLAASPEYLASHGTPPNPKDLLQHSCLLYKGLLEPQRWHFRRSAHEAFEPLIVSGKLVRLLSDWDISAYADELHIEIRSPENRLRSQKVREVSAFLVDAIGSPPYWDNL